MTEKAVQHSYEGSYKANKVIYLRVSALFGYSKWKAASVQRGQSVYRLNHYD